jgi:hypothetical protein
VGTLALAILVALVFTYGYSTEGVEIGLVEREGKRVLGLVAGLCLSKPKKWT